MVGGCRTTFGFFVRPTPAAGTIIDHSIGAKVLVAVQGPWRLSARADRKTLTDAYLDILIRSHYSRTARSRKAAEGRERVFRAKLFKSHRARIPGPGKGLSSIYGKLPYPSTFKLHGPARYISTRLVTFCTFEFCVATGALDRICAV